MVQQTAQLHAGGCRHPPARAAAVAVGADLEPEAGRFAAVFDRVLEREPDMVVERPAAEQAARVAVDAGDVQIEMQVGIIGLEPVIELGGERLGRGHDGVLEFLLVLGEPGTVVIEPDAPEYVDGLIGIASEHDAYSL